MIRRLLRRYRPEPPRPQFQDVLMVRVMRGIYDWQCELDGGVR